jgi:hypothetical protein
MAVSIRVYMSNLIMIGLAVQKLLAFLFSIGNALKGTKFGVLGDFRGETVIFIILTPKVHILGPKDAFGRITRPNRSTRLIRARF